MSAPTGRVNDPLFAAASTRLLTKEQAEILHQATDAAQLPGACHYRMHPGGSNPPKPGCVIAQADALSGGEGWKTIPEGVSCHDIMARDKSAFPSLRQYPIDVLKDLQRMWDAFHHDDVDVTRQRMHARINVSTVGR